MKNKNIIYISIFLFLLLLTGCTKKHTHNYSLEWEWGKDVIAIFTCDCGEDSTQKLLASTKEEVIAEADCINDGEIRVTAKVMFNNILYEETRIITTPKKGHDVILHESKEATCTEKGWEAYECTRCGYTTYREIVVDHNIVRTVIKPGPVTEGYTIDSCSDCDYLYKHSYIPQILNLELEDAYYVVTGVNDYGILDITIPETYNDLPVKAISAEAFRQYTSLTSVTIGNNVTSIGDSAFFRCGGLTSVTIGNNVTSIGDSAFFGCGGLTSVSIPDSVTSIGDSAFGYCSSLTNITIPNSVTTIGKYEFYDCYSLTNITIPSSVTSIGEYAFSNCSSLESIAIPESVTSIGYRAFSGCSSLTIYCEVTSEPSGWNSNWNSSNILVYWGINETNFYEENGIQYVLNTETKEAIISEYVGNDDNIVINETIAFNDKVYRITSIGDSAFLNCTSMTNITIPEGVTSIRECAFSNCSSLESIAIPESVTSIGEYAFSNCSSLESIAIPESVTSIGEYAFFNCSSLESMTLPFIGNTSEGTSNTHFGYIFGASSYYNNRYYVPTSLKEVIINGGSSIGENAFYGCYSLTNIIIPDSVTSIENFAFCNCTSMTNITIPDGVTSIGDSAFFHCTSITNITIPDGVTSIGENAFDKCDSLESIVIPESVTSIEEYAFNNCDSLESIVIPDSVTSIGDRAFSECSSLTIYCEVTSEPSGWNSIWNHSNRPVYWGINETNFYEENEIQYVLNTETKEATISKYVGDYANIVINETIAFNDKVYRITSIGDSTFSNCSSLKSIVIPSSITSIGEDAFVHCKSLTNIIIPDSVTSIRRSAFSNCDSLTNIIIPDSVTSIESYAFSNCISLTNIMIPDSVTSIENFAFSGCTELTIYCEVSSKPSRWSNLWNYTNCPVVWGYK